MTGDTVGKEARSEEESMIARSIDQFRRDLYRPDPVGVPLILLSGLFSLLLIFSPMLVEKGSIDLGDGGTVGEVDHDDVISGIENPLARFAYRFGDRYCHQKDHRSLFLNGNQMPVCARDIGLFAGIFLGCIFGAMYRKGIKIWVLGILLVPMAVDGGLQALTAYESYNILRVLTGLLGGFGIGAYVNGTLVSTVRILMYKPKKG